MTVKDEKKNAIKRSIKEKLGVNNINDLVLMTRTYNGGMFGCTTDTPSTSQQGFTHGNSNMLFGNINNSHMNPCESGTIGAALGINQAEV